MRRYFNLSGRRALFLSLILLVLIYALFQARFLILGPQVRITYPAHGDVVDAGEMMLEGKAGNVAWISLNGRQIFVDEEGVFSEKLITPIGPSIITVSAKDRFGRETEKRIQILAR